MHFFEGFCRDKNVRYIELRLLKITLALMEVKGWQNIPERHSTSKIENKLTMPGLKKKKDKQTNITPQDTT